MPEAGSPVQAETAGSVRPPDDPPPDPRSDPIGFPPGFGEGASERDHLLAMRCLLGIDPSHLHQLIWRLGTAAEVVAAIARGVGGSDADRAFLRGADPDRIRASVGSCGARFVAPGEEAYPPAFLRLQEPPPGIFVRGEDLRVGDQRVSIVGTRRPSPVGRDVARALAARLAIAGVVVVSGGALGIDAVAHRAALDAGGRSVAVLGSGIDDLSPRTNRGLLEELLRHGTVLSEYPPGVPAHPHRFPPRNRLIAALSRAVVLVEGTRRSGTRLTAEHALTIGIDLFAVPGSVASALSETPLEILREGARLIRDADDLLLDLGLDAGAPPTDGPTGLPGDLQRVLDAVDRPMLPDAVARRVRLSIPDAMTLLIELEMRSLIRGVGGRFERTFDRGRSGSEPGAG
jgi:DNA processing protein